MGKLVNFKEYTITEAVNAKDMDRIKSLVQRYLSKKAGVKIFALAGIESVQGAAIVGIRFFIPKTNHSFRLNWATSGAMSMELDSFTYWKSKKDAQIVSFNKKISIVQVLPIIGDIIREKGKLPKRGFSIIPQEAPLNEDKNIGSAFNDAVWAIKNSKSISSIEKEGGAIALEMFYILQDEFPDSIEVASNGKIKWNGSSSEFSKLSSGSTLSRIKSLVSEGVISEGKVEDDMYDEIITMLESDSFTKGKVHSRFKGKGIALLDAIVDVFSDVIERKGNKFIISNFDVLRAGKEEVFNYAGVVDATVSRARGENYEVDRSIEEIEDNRERLTFEQQLDDLEKLVTFTISGANNALFVAGRGGVGKTHTVEEMLSRLGYTDGNEYFKNTGSISTAGLYSLLFKYRDKMVFFDDSDDVFKDQSSRNLLKAATDTKKRRKLVWNKQGANVVDPDEMSDDEILEQGLIPRYFDFTGRIVFISNLSRKKLDPDGALSTRGYILDVDPTDTEVYDFMEKIVDNIKLNDGLELSSSRRKDVVDLLRNGTSAQSANLRKLSRGLNMAAGAEAAGVRISNNELERLISTYA